MVWLLYRILRHTCHIHFIRKHSVAHFSDYGTSSRAGYGTYTITAHHYAALSLLPVSVYPAQVVHPNLLHMLRKMQAHSVFTTCWYPHLPQFILYVLWQPCGCICRYSRMMAANHVAWHGHHTTSVSAICTAATVNSCLLVWLPLVACFHLHSQGSRLFYLFFS